VFLTLFEMSPMMMVMVMMMLDVYLTSTWINLALHHGSCGKCLLLQGPKTKPGLVLCMLFALLRVNSLKCQLVSTARLKDFVYPLRAKRVVKVLILP